MNPAIFNMCCLRSFRPTGLGVKYGPHRISDPVLRETLDTISLRLGQQIILTSGDRHRVVNGNNRSHHLQGRAADFYVENIDLRNAFAKIKQMDLIQQGYQLIYHTEDTVSPHLHLGRYHDNRPSSFNVDRGEILPVR